MPAVKAIKAKHSNTTWKELKKEIKNLIKKESTKSFFFKKYKINPEDFLIFEKRAIDLNWLTNQEINSIIEYKVDLHDKIMFLFHRFRFSYLPKIRVSSKIPAYVLVEPTSICNMRCPMCFQTDKSFTTKDFMGRIDIDFFKSIVDECYKEGIGAMTLASRGEPTLHPELSEMIDYTKDKVMEMKLNTNASKLSPEISRSILNSSISHLVFSIDSHLKEEYEAIRVGGKFEKVFENVKNFWNMRNSDEFKNKKLRVSVSGVKVYDSQDPVEFSKFWNNFADDAYLNKVEDRWDTYNNSLLPDLIDTCIYPWERLYIWHDGTINPCDVDYKSELSPGNIKQIGGIVKGWEKLNYLRDAHLNGSRGNVSPCDRCGVSHPTLK